jgi:predicted dinucleotide-binding enzyme
MSTSRIAVSQKPRRGFLGAWAAMAIGTLIGLPFAAAAQSAAAPKMKIGIIGSGQAGGAIGAAWVRAGHEVMFSSLDLEADKRLAARLGPNAHAGTTSEAAAYGPVLLIAVPYSALPGIGKQLGDSLKGKIVIDTSNPIVARDGEVAVAARKVGAGVASAEYLPGARIVRAFNAISAGRMAVASTNSVRIGMPIAGDDEKAIGIASALVRDVGYEPVLVGTLAGMGKYLLPGTPLAGERSPDEIRKVAATLK